MTRVAVIGYAAIDYPAVLDGFYAGDRTVMMRRPGDAFPRPGGCPLYVARPMAEKGIAVSIVTWVGADRHGRLFTSRAEQDGIGVEGIATIEPGSTPVAFMIYQRDGSCGCLFDPGMLGHESLREHQAALIATADLLCVTVGPPDVAAEALAMIGANCKVAWVMKNDPVSYPESLRVALASRVDYIFCNRQERAWVDGALAARGKSPAVSESEGGPTIIETAGGGAVTVEGNHRPILVEVEPLCFYDSTGAGDTLAGGCLAAILAGETDPRAVAESGIGAAATLLRGRSYE